MSEIPLSRGESLFKQTGWSSPLFPAETTQILSLLEQLSFCSFQSLADRQATCKAALSLSHSSSRKLLTALIHIVKQQPLDIDVVAVGSDLPQARQHTQEMDAKLKSNHIFPKSPCIRRLLLLFHWHAIVRSMPWQLGSFFSQLLRLITTAQVNQQWHQCS